MRWRKGDEQGYRNTENMYYITNRTYLYFKGTISSSLQWGKIKRCQVGNIYMLGNS